MNCARGNPDRLGQKSHDRVGCDRLSRSGFSNDAQDLTALQIEGDILDGVGPLHPSRQTYVKVAHRERYLLGVDIQVARGHWKILLFQPSPVMLLRAESSAPCVPALLRQLNNSPLKLPFPRWRLRHDSD